MFYFHYVPLRFIAVSFHCRCVALRWLFEIWLVGWSSEKTKTFLHTRISHVVPPRALSLSLYLSFTVCLSRNLCLYIHYESPPRPQSLASFYHIYIFDYCHSSAVQLAVLALSHAFHTRTHTHTLSFLRMLIVFFVFLYFV